MAVKCALYIARPPKEDPFDIGFDWLHPANETRLVLKSLCDVLFKNSFCSFLYIIWYIWPLPTKSNLYSSWHSYLRKCRLIGHRVSNIRFGGMIGYLEVVTISPISLCCSCSCPTNRGSRTMRWRYFHYIYKILHNKDTKNFNVNKK